MHPRDAFFASTAGIVSAHPLLVYKLRLQVIGTLHARPYAGLGWYLTKSTPASTLNLYLLHTPMILALPPWCQGTTCRLLTTFMLYPLGLWSTQRQAGHAPSGWYRGVTNTGARDLVFSAIFMQINRGLLADSTLPAAVIGALSGVGASALTIPLDYGKLVAQFGRSAIHPSMWVGAGTRIAYCAVRGGITWGLIGSMSK